MAGFCLSPAPRARPVTPDLATVVAARSTLSEAIRSGILASDSFPETGPPQQIAAGLGISPRTIGPFARRFSGSTRGRASGCIGRPPLRGAPQKQAGAREDRAGLKRGAGAGSFSVLSGARWKPKHTRALAAPARVASARQWDHAPARTA